jgi:hypothetical protein
LTKQVPWGAAKPAVKPAAPEPAKASLFARKVPWFTRKTTAPAPPPGPPDPMVTHLPWAAPEPTPPSAAPAPAAPIVTAKRVPWSWRKKPKVAPPPLEKIVIEDSAPGAASWALPKDAAAVAVTQEEIELARDARPPDDNEPTAEQLVALLSKLPVRKAGAPATTAPATTATPNAQAPYKARPISFEPTRWDSFMFWAYAYRRRLSIAGTVLVLTLVTAYLLQLVSLNMEIDRQWLQLEKALRDRYALVPSYVHCIETFTDREHFTLALAERRLTAWRAAHTEEQLVRTATEMERSLALLSRAMKRCEQEVPAKDPDQLDSSQEFARLEKEREQSRVIAIELVQRYNATVENFNAKVQAVPGSWVAWVADLHSHRPIFADG